MRFSRRHKHGSLIISTILVTGALTLSVIAGVHIRSVVQTRIEQIRDQYINGLRTFLDAGITWERISPSFLHGVTVYAPVISAREDRTSISASTLRIGISLRAFVGKKANDIISGVHLRNPRIVLADQDELNRFIDLIRYMQSFQRIQPNLTVSFDRGSLMVAPDGMEIALADVRGTVVLGPEDVRTDIDATVDVDIEVNDVSAGTVIAVSADLKRDMSTVSATVRLADTKTRIGSIADQVWHLSRDDAVWNVRKIEDQLPLDLQVRWRENSGVVSVSLRSEDLNLRDLFTPAPDTPPGLTTILNQRLSTDSFAEVDIYSRTITDASGWITSVVPAGRLPRSVPFEMQYEYADRILTVAEGRVWGAEGYADVSGRFSLSLSTFSGTADLHNLSYGPIPRTTGIVAFTGSSGFLGISSSECVFGVSPVYDLQAQWETPRTAAENAPEFSNGTVSFRLDSSGLESVGLRIRYQDQDNFQVSLRTGNTDVQTVVTLAAEFGFSLDTTATIPTGTFASLTMVLDRREGAVEAEISRFVMLNTGENSPYLFTRGRYTRDTFIIDRFYARAAGYAASGDALVHIAQGGTIHLDTNLTVQGISYSFRALYSPDNSLIVSGDHGVNVRLFWGRNGSVRMSGELSDTPIPGTSATITAGFSGRYADRENWFVEISDSHIVGLIAPGIYRKTDIRFFATVNPQSVAVAVTEFNDGFSSLTGTGNLEYRLTPELEMQAGVRLLSLDGTERYQATASYSTDALTADVLFTGLPLKRIHPRFVRGRADGRVYLSGTPQDYGVELNLASRDAVIGEQDVSASLSAAWDPSGFRAHDVLLGIGPQRIRIDSVVVFAPDGAIRAGGEYARPEREVTVPFVFEGAFEQLPRIDLQSLTTASLQARMDLSGEKPMEFDIARLNQTTSIRKRDGAIDATIDDEGSFTATLRSPGAVQAVVDGTIRTGLIEATAQDVRIDLVKAGLFGNGIEILAGTASGGIRVLGNVSDPEFFGTLSLRGIELETGFTAQPVGPFNASMVIEEKLARMQRATVPSGQAFADLTGEFLLHRFQVDTYRIVIRTQSDEGIHVVRNFGVVDVDGYARGALTIDGSRDAIDVGGDLTVYRAQVALGDATQETDLADPVAITLALKLTSGRAVQFIWPNDDFPILRSNFATGQEVNVEVNTTENRFAFNGDIEIQSGDIFYFDRNFLIRDGLIRFQETEERFDPRLSVRAEIREVAAGEPVRIYLVADENRLSEFSPRFESTPTLTNTDIIAILGGNILEQTGTSSVSLSSALLSTSDIVTQFGVFRQFEETLRRRMDLDLFAVRTSFLQNVLLSAITPSDPEAPQLTPSIGSYLNNTSVFMGRYIGSSVFAQFLLQMRSRDYEDQFGTGDTGIQEIGGVLIDSEISLEWQTPFFLLEWTLAPQYPEELFIRDNTFTFSWRYSY